MTNSTLYIYPQFTTVTSVVTDIKRKLKSVDRCYLHFPKLSKSIGLMIYRNDAKDTLLLIKNINKLLAVAKTIYLEELRVVPIKSKLSYTLVEHDWEDSPTGKLWSLRAFEPLSVFDKYTVGIRGLK